MSVLLMIFKNQVLKSPSKTMHITQN